MTEDIQQEKMDVFDYIKVQTLRRWNIMLMKRKEQAGEFSHRQVLFGCIHDYKELNLKVIKSTVNPSVWAISPLGQEEDSHHGR